MSEQKLSDRLWNYVGAGVPRELAEMSTALEAENASLQQRVEALERVHFWVKSYMISMKADMSSRLAAKDGLEQALAAAQEQGGG